MGGWKGLLAASSSLSKQRESGWKGLLGGEVLQAQVCISADLQIEHFRYLDPDFFQKQRAMPCAKQGLAPGSAQSGDAPGRTSFHLCAEGPKKPDQALSVICIRSLQVP